MFEQIVIRGKNQTGILLDADTSFSEYISKYDVGEV